MTTYATGNPLGSKDPRDLYDNAENFDAAMNDRVNTTWNDRFGVSRPTMKGYEEQFNDWLDAQGFEPGFLEYVDGSPLTVDRSTQLIQRDGNLYSVKRPASFPVTLSGNWAADEPLLVAQVDRTLQDTLATSAGAGMIGYRERTVADRLNDTANVKDYGAIADGAYHPLSERFATLAEAQAVYPHATALTDSIDWAACQAALNSGGIVDFSGNPRNYNINRDLVVAVDGTTLLLRKCAFTASPSFSGVMMLDIRADHVSLIGGATFHAANMPRPTADFSTSSFIGFVIGQKGTEDNVYSGLNVTGGTILVNDGPAAAIGLQYCTDFHIDNVYGYYCDNSASYVGPGVIYFNRCTKYSVREVGASNFKWKGLYNANGSDFSVDTAFCTDGVEDQAAIFFAMCNGFEANQLQSRKSFGVKLDRCNDFSCSGIHANCNDIGQIGVMIQGCIGYSLNQIFVRGYAIAGIEVSYHPGPPAANALVGVINGFEIRNGKSGSLAALRIFGSTTETVGQLQISGGYIYSCSRGIVVRNIGSSVLNRQFSVKDVVVDTFDVAGIEGVSREMSIRGVEFFNVSSSAVACIDLHHEPGQTCDFVSISNCSTGNVPSGVNFIRATSTTTRRLKIGDVMISGCTFKGGARLLDLAMTQTDDYVRTLNVFGNTHNGAASGTSVGLGNSAITGNTQVSIIGNMLLGASLSKVAINFVETAASGRWNGVVENNMATINNKPNNV